jgi:hypothetical protein
MARTKPNYLLVMLLSQLWALVYAVIKQAGVDFASAVSLPTSVNVYDLSPRPALVITVSQKTSDAKIKVLETAGFTPRTNGRYRYYVGPSTDDAVRSAILQGVVTDAFAPGNAVSVNGLVLYSYMSRIFFHALHVLSLSIEVESKDALFEDTELPPATPAFKLHEANLTELPAKGFFFPYFDGLLLPDKGLTITRFIQYFSPLFGTKPAAVADATKTFVSGWSSLADTIAGKEYSHMMYSIDLAVQCGIKLRPVYLAGQYSGCVFYTSDTIVSVGASTYVPQDQSELKEGIEKMKSHDSALVEICSILNEIVGDDDGEENRALIDSSLLTTARALHYALKSRTLGPATMAKIAPLVRKLQFEQNLWDVTNPKHVQAAVALITTKTFPDVQVPMNLRIDAIFTKQPIYSVLGAFGTKAPSLRGSGTQIVRRIAPKFYEQLDKPGRLVGIPVFAKSHQEAKEDWEAILSEFTVFFDSKGKDKEGKLRVKNVSAFIPFDTDEAKGISGSLLKLLSSRKRKEREDEDESGPAERTQKEMDDERKVKRRKEKGYGMLGLSFGLAQGDADMPVDDDEDIFS